MTADEIDWQRTVPWTADEYVTVNGQRFVYVIEAGLITVRLPGGGKTTIAALRAAGHDVAYPLRVRRQ
jgi:hypothetical protein